MLQLKDIFKAPLDAAYGSLKQINTESDRDMIDRHFSVKEQNDPITAKKYGTPLRTLVPLENIVQFKNKNGVTQEISGPTMAFEQLTSLHLKELVLDFDVGISEMRRRSDGELIVNAALQPPSAGNARAGGFHFSVIYKNELPAGVSKLQNIFSDVLDGQYTILKDSDDIGLEARGTRRLAISKVMKPLTSDVEFILSNQSKDNGGNLLLSILLKVCMGVEIIRKYESEYPEESVAAMTRLDSILRSLPSLDRLGVHLSLSNDSANDFGLRYRTLALESDRYITDRIYMFRTDGGWNIPSDAGWSIADTSFLMPARTTPPTPDSTSE